MSTPSNLESVHRDVIDELNRQRQKWGQQDHTLPMWLTILGEEVGEACRHTLEGRRSHAYHEFIHVAAVAMSAAECILRNKDAELPDVTALQKRIHALEKEIRVLRANQPETQASELPGHMQPSAYDRAMRDQKYFKRDGGPDESVITGIPRMEICETGG